MTARWCAWCGCPTGVYPTDVGTDRYLLCEPCATMAATAEPPATPLRAPVRELAAAYAAWRGQDDRGYADLQALVENYLMRAGVTL